MRRSVRERGGGRGAGGMEGRGVEEEDEERIRGGRRERGGGGSMGGRR